MNKRRIITAVTMCVLLILTCVVVGFTLDNKTAYAEIVGDVVQVETTEEDTVADGGFSSEELDAIFKKFEAWIDKYIMPLAISILTAISLVVTVFLKFKQMFNLYKMDKQEFVLTADSKVADIKKVTDEAIDAIKNVREQVTETVKNMPIEKISQTLQTNTADTLQNTEALKKFKELFALMFKINRESDKNLICSEDERKHLAKLYDEADKVVASVTQSNEWKAVAERPQGEKNEN